MIKGIEHFQTVLPFWNATWENSFQENYTSGHSGEVGDRFGKNEMKMG